MLLYDTKNIALYARDTLSPDRRCTCSIYSRRDGDAGVSEQVLVARRGWTQERARAALENMLLRDGLCWLDEQDPEYGVSYWVPSAMRWDE